MNNLPDLSTIRDKMAQGVDFDKWCDAAIESTLTLHKPLTKDEVEARLVFTVVLLSMASCAECCSGTVCVKHVAKGTEERLLDPARKLLEQAFA